MSLDIKRKFLLKDGALLELLNSWEVVFKSSKYSYFYTNSIKFIKTDDKFFYQKDSDLLPIGQDEFIAAKNGSSNIVSKQIYSFKLNGNLCNIEVFQGELSGLYILEIAFNDELYGVFFKPPKFLTNFIVREVTLEREFNEQNLTPLCMFENFDFAEALRVFKTFMIAPNFPKNLRTKDAVCALLYYYLIEILTLKDDLKSEFNEQKFLTLYEKISLTKISFELFFDIFDEKTAEFFLANFTKLLNSCQKSIKILKALLFLDELKNAAWLEFFLENAFEIEIKNAKKVIENEDFLKDWEIFLSDTSDFFVAKNYDEILKISLAKRARSYAISSAKFAKGIGEQSENDEFFTLLSKLERVEILFQGFRGTTFSGQILERANKLIKRLKELKELDNILTLVQKLPQDEQADEQCVRIYAKIYKIRTKTLRGVKKFIKAVLQGSKELKNHYKKA
ncbi:MULTISPECIES: hypothetical protein [unclassified Campylobacter]|uniref:hypothetical protein n=1 Tax=unclassified Campylobacter TaxID=2593542 RepID=UPI003D346279